MFNNFNELPKNLVESGYILKSNEVVLIISNIKVILSLLILSPDSKIKYHVHTNDSEIYILNNKDKDIFFCEKGKGHELKNNSDKILEVLSVKFFTLC